MASATAMLKSTVINSQRPQATVIFLHGLGGTGANYEDLIKPIAPLLPNVKFILPQAPTRYVSIYGRTTPAWYDITGIERDVVEDDQGIKESAKSIHKLIDQEVTKGISSNRIIIAGGSQGGALALYAGLTYPKTLGGIIAISTYLPLHQSFPEYSDSANTETPLLMCHGEADDVVRFDWGKESYELLRTKHTNTRFRSYPGLGHAPSTEVIWDVVQFVMNLVLRKPE